MGKARRAAAKVGLFLLSIFSLNTFADCIDDATNAANSAPREAGLFATSKDEEAPVLPLHQDTVDQIFKGIEVEGGAAARAKLDKMRQEIRSNNNPFWAEAMDYLRKKPHQILYQSERIGGERAGSSIWFGNKDGLVQGSKLLVHEAAHGFEFDPNHPIWSEINREKNAPADDAVKMNRTYVNPVLKEFIPNLYAMGGDWDAAWRATWEETASRDVNLLRERLITSNTAPRSLFLADMNGRDAYAMLLDLLAGKDISRFSAPK